MVNIKTTDLSQVFYTNPHHFLKAPRALPLSDAPPPPPTTHTPPPPSSHSSMTRHSDSSHKKCQKSSAADAATVTASGQRRWLSLVGGVLSGSEHVVAGNQRPQAE